MSEMEEKHRELIKNNWNRMAELSSRSRTAQEQAEYEFRIAIQNTFASGEEKEAIEQILWLNKEC